MITRRPVGNLLFRRMPGDNALLFVISPPLLSADRSFRLFGTETRFRVIGGRNPSGELFPAFAAERIAADIRKSGGRITDAVAADYRLAEPEFGFRE